MLTLVQGHLNQRLCIQFTRKKYILIRVNKALGRVTFDVMVEEGTNVDVLGGVIYDVMVGEGTNVEALGGVMFDVMVGRVRTRSVVV